MAELACQWYISAQLKLHFAAMAAAVQFRLEAIIRLVDSVWCSVLPLLFLGNAIHVWSTFVLVLSPVLRHGLTVLAFSQL